MWIVAHFLAPFHFARKFANEKKELFKAGGWRALFWDRQTQLVFFALAGITFAATGAVIYATRKSSKAVESQDSRDKRSVAAEMQKAMGRYKDEGFDDDNYIDSRGGEQGLTQRERINPADYKDTQEKNKTWRRNRDLREGIDRDQTRDSEMGTGRLNRFAEQKSEQSKGRTQNPRTIQERRDKSGKAWGDAQSDAANQLSAKKRKAKQQGKPASVHEQLNGDTDLPKQPALDKASKNSKCHICLKNERTNKVTCDKCEPLVDKCKCGFMKLKDSGLCRVCLRDKIKQAREDACHKEIAVELLEEMYGAHPDVDTDIAQGIHQDALAKASMPSCVVNAKTSALLLPADQLDYKVAPTYANAKAIGQFLVMNYHTTLVMKGSIAAFWGPELMNKDAVILTKHPQANLPCGGKRVGNLVYFPKPKDMTSAKLAANYKIGQSVHTYAWVFENGKFHWKMSSGKLTGDEKSLRGVLTPDGKSKVDLDGLLMYNASAAAGWSGCGVHDDQGNVICIHEASTHGVEEDPKNYGCPVDPKELVETKNVSRPGLVDNQAGPGPKSA